MIAFITIIENNLGFSFITILTILFNFGVVVFMARDFRIGSIIMLITNALLFLWSYNNGWDYSILLALMLLSVGLLSLTLWTNNNYSKGGLV
jgi:hypothetical protein